MKDASQLLKCCCTNGLRKNQLVQKRGCSTVLFQTEKRRVSSRPRRKLIKDAIIFKYKIGDLVTGKVTKLASFGAFVQSQDDIDGLVHISQLSEEHVTKVTNFLKVGQEVEARVIKVGQSRAPHRPFDQGGELPRGRS